MATPTRVLVTGGTGFIGKEVIKKLVLEGYTVLALARRMQDLPHNQGTCLASYVLKGDLSLLSSKEISSFMKEYKVDIVVHLAAVMNFYPKDEAYMWHVNVEGTRKIATASAEASVKKIIFISSTEAMGARATPSAHALTETSPCLPHFKYGHSKVAAENVLKEFSDRLPYVILRVTGVLGPGDDFAIYELLVSVSFGLFFFAPINDGKAMFTHIDDVVHGIMCAIPDRKNILGNTYIICPNTTLTYSECISLACKKLNRVQPIIKLPIPVIRVITKLVGPLLNLGKKKVFLFKTDTIDRMGEDRWYSNDKAKKELGFRPQYTFEEGLQHTVNYMVKKGEVNTWPISPVMLFFLACVVGTVFWLCK